MNARNTLDFLLYDWIQVHTLTDRPRFADHSRETFEPGAGCLREASRAKSTHRSTGWSMSKSRSSTVRR
jgi:hypothetical protein